MFLCEKMIRRTTIEKVFERLQKNRFEGYGIHRDHPLVWKLNENVDIAITSTWGDIKCALKM